MTKTFENPLPADVGCGCTSLREALDKVLAEVQTRINAGECIHAIFMEAAMWGIVGNAMIVADEAGLLDDAAIVELRLAMAAHVDSRVLSYATGVIAAAWGTPAEEAMN